MQKNRRTDGVSTRLMRFIDGLSLREREVLADALRDPRTYIAEDLDDLLIIVRQLERQRLASGGPPTGA